VLKASIKLCLAVASVFFVALANASNFKISEESEALYFKALPYLVKIDELTSNLYAARDQLPINEKFPAQKKQQYKDEVQALLKEGMPLLKRSAEDGNPAAQYRLAFMSSSDQISEEEACTLLRSSLSNGFTPAGLQMFFICSDEAKTAGFRSLIEALPKDETIYKKYYPQPTMLPTCDIFSDRPSIFTIVSLDERSFRANLYMRLSNQMSTPNLKQEQLRYLNKAAENGCAEAIMWLNAKR
jgi:TPR repeat protein